MKLNQNRLSAQPDQTMFPEVEAALTYKMFSHSGRKIACSSLRPGMRIRTSTTFTWTIIQNSSKLKRIELRHGSVSMVELYHNLAYNPDFQVLPPSLWYRIKKFLKR